MKKIVLIMPIILLFLISGCAGRETKYKDIDSFVQDFYKECNIDENPKDFIEGLRDLLVIDTSDYDFSGWKDEYETNTIMSKDVVLDKLPGSLTVYVKENPDAEFGGRISGSLSSQNGMSDFLYAKTMIESMIEEYGSPDYVEINNEENSSEADLLEVFGSGYSEEKEISFTVSWEFENGNTSYDVVRVGYSNYFDFLNKKYSNSYIVFSASKLPK